MNRTAYPFNFRDSIRLTSPTGASAATLREFLVAIESVHSEVLHHHLRETPLRYPFRPGDLPNDFAIWAARGLEDSALAERLAVLDPFHERDIEILRERVVEAVETSLEEDHHGRSVLPGREFFFSRSYAVEIELGITAGSMDELLQCLETIPATSLYYHVYEARLRNPDGRDDISVWLDTSLGAQHLTVRLSDLDIYLLSLENCRRVIVELLEDGYDLS
jgi:hypothetical protein